MPPSPEYKGFPYRKILIVGATSGIGQDLAAKLVAEGKKIIIAGRRQHRLEAFVKEHSNASGEQQIWTEVLDLEELDGIEGFIKKITSSHGDLDSVILVSGKYEGLNFTKPETVDLDRVKSEVFTNYLSYVYFTKHILPHLLALSAEGKPTSLMFTTSGTAFAPIARGANYAATKAALHHFALSLRNQLNYGDGTGVKIVELIPPLLETEIPLPTNEPAAHDGEKVLFPLKEYTKLTWQGLLDGKDEIPVGLAKKLYDAVETPRKKLMANMPQAPAVV